MSTIHPRNDRVTVAGDPPFNLAGFASAPWMADALCAEIDGDLWSPEKGRSAREAKSVCRRCPVAAECVSYALEHSETAGRFGVWGGLTERERRKLRHMGGDAA